MSDSLSPKLPKWPFFLGDLLLLGAAYAVLQYSQTPLDLGRLCLLVGAVALGAGFSIYPFVHEFRLATKVAEAGALTTVTAQMGNLETAVSQIQAATSRWQGVQEAADKTAAQAGQIAERMTSEAKAFAGFMQNANDAEKATLRLEVEKLRRSEGEWLQATVHILDHIYALNQGAIRSGQPKLIENLGAFQNVCRDLVRRVGLTAYGARPDELFDPQKHKLPEGDSAKAAGQPIISNLACGYTFQGRLLRPALVRVQASTDPLDTQAEADDEPPSGRDPEPDDPARPA